MWEDVQLYCANMYKYCRELQNKEILQRLLLLLLLVEICRRCHWYRWKIATGIIDTGGKFAAGVNYTSGTFTCEYLREFSKKFEMTLLLFSEAMGEDDSWKKPEEKISWHYPLKYPEKNHRVTVRNFVAKIESFAEGCDEHRRLDCSQYETKAQPAPHTYSAAFAKVPCSSH